MDHKEISNRKLTCRGAAEAEVETAVAAMLLVRLSESGGPPAEETSVAMRILSIIMFSVSMIAFFGFFSVREEWI